MQATLERAPADRAPAERRPWTRVLLFVLPAVAFVALFARALVGTEPPKPGELVPAFREETLDGGSLTLRDLRGKPVVVNFWASWCIPCIEEAPMWREANRRYGDEIRFLGVNVRDARSRAEGFVAEYGLAFEHLRDEDLSLFDDWGLISQPETFVIDEDGRLIEHVPGPVTPDYLDALLASVARS